LAGDEIVNYGVEVGSLFGGPAVRATAVAEVIEYEVHRDIELGLRRWACSVRGHGTQTND